MEKNLPKPNLPIYLPDDDRLLEGQKDQPYGRARYPEYHTRASRTDSFQSWPIPQQIDPEGLVNAGFFYEGVGDRIQCFVCGAVFHNLDEFFSPKEEHRELLPHCNFARLYKENPKALVEVVDIPAVKAVVELGFPLPDVEQAYRQLTQTGNQSPKAGDLLDVIWATPKSCNLTNGSHDPSEESRHEGPREEEEEEEEDLYAAGPSGSLPQACANYESDGEGEEDEEPVIEIDIKKLHQEQAEGARLRRKLDQLEHVGKCRGCNDKKADTVNLPCGHIATCQECVYKYNRCRICNTLIQGIVKVYMV